MIDSTSAAAPTRPISLGDVQADWRALDAPDFQVPEGVRLISHEQFTSVPELKVEYVPPGRPLTGQGGQLHDWQGLAHVT